MARVVYCSSDECNFAVPAVNVARGPGCDRGRSTHSFTRHTHAIVRSFGYERWATGTLSGAVRRSRAGSSAPGG